MATAYATLQDITDLFRPLTTEESDRATALLPVVSDQLRQYALNVGKDLDQMITDGKVLSNTVKSVTVDVVARVLMTSTDDEPMTQTSESALGYTFSGSFLVPGGGLFIKTEELKKLGLYRQKLGGISMI